MTSVDDNDTLQIRPDPDKLFVYHRQQLSAMLDGELSPDEAKFMLRRLQHDVELAACWERWQVCGDVLRGQRNELLPADFARRVAAAVGADAGVEAAPAAARRAARPRLARWGGGAAVAASVALMAVFASRQLPDAGLAPAATPTPMVAQGATPSPVVMPVQAPAAASDPAPSPPAAQPDAAMALAAVAAAAEVPRRAAQRRASNPQPRVAPVETAQPPMAVAANGALPPTPVAEGAIAASAAFAMPQATARPWPRSLLAPQGSFTVASGGLLPREPEFEPLLPGGRVAPWSAPEAAAPQADAAQP